MFGLSSFEFIMIAIVALLVLGPKRLPKAARTAGMLFRKAQRSWFHVRSEIERELALDELRERMKEQEQAIRDLSDGVNQELEDVNHSVKQIAQEGSDALSSVADASGENPVAQTPEISAHTSSEAEPSP